MRRTRVTAANVEALIKQAAATDGPGVIIRMEKEGGASGKSLIDLYHRLLPGYNFSGQDPSGDKAVRAQTWSGAAEHGNVRLVRGAWNLPFLNEVEQFQTKGVHDDQVDVISGATRALREAQGSRIHFAIG